MLRHPRSASRFAKSLLILGAVSLVGMGCTTPPEKPDEPSVAREALNGFAGAIQNDDRVSLREKLCGNMVPESVDATLDDLGADGRTNLARLLDSAAYDAPSSTPTRTAYLLVDAQGRTQPIYIQQNAGKTCVEAP